MTIILGVDPGSRITGYGLITARGAVLQHVASGNIKISKIELQDKLKEIFLCLSDIIARFKPNESAIEQVFVCRNANSALKLGQARGAALVALAQYNLPVAEYAPRQIKNAIVGYGGADKNQIQRMVKSLLKLDKLPTEDAADALAIAITHAHTSRGLQKFTLYTSNSHS